jgi:hypothetical protein
MVSQEQMEPTSLHICRTFIGTNELEVTKLQPPWSKGIVFIENSWSNNSQPIFEPLKKSLNITLLSLELQDDL